MVKKVVGKGRKRVEEELGQSKLTDKRFSGVYVFPSGKRVPFSIRIDSGIKRAWMQFVLDKGLSSCEIVEKTLLGIMHGYEAPVYASHTINVIVDFPRVVKRVRRRQIYFEDEVSVSEVGVSGFPKLEVGDVRGDVLCGFCGKSAVGLAEHCESGKKVFVCEYHRKGLLEHSKWKVLH